MMVTFLMSSNTPLWLPVLPDEEELLEDGLLLDAELLLEAGLLLDAELLEEGLLEDAALLLEEGLPEEAELEVGLFEEPPEEVLLEVLFSEALSLDVVLLGFSSTGGTTISLPTSISLLDKIWSNGVGRLKLSTQMSNTVEVLTSLFVTCSAV